jgi:glycerophosphoryl diester phosphodiesterase
MTEAGIEVIGHRGARGLFPENTLEGFRAAWDLGVRSFELDVGMTADGQVVVSHDAGLNPDITRDRHGRWLSGAGPLIHARRAEELAEYDVGRIRPGSPASARFPGQRPHDGARIPSLAAVLTALPSARFIIEVKTDPRHPEWTADPDRLAETVLREVRRADAEARVVLESFDWRVQRFARRAQPDIRLAFLTSADAPPDPWWAGIKPTDHGGSVPSSVAAAAPQGGIWAPAHTGLTAELVTEAHNLGLRVLPWTVNRPDDMDRLIGWGVDGIISDYPDLLGAVVARATSR